jgi:signal transduction histidine kinase
MAEKKEQLEQAVETKNRFIGMAAHDMRNPLTAMLGYSQLLLDETVGPMAELQTKFVGSIHKASEALLQLVNELLEISEIDSGNLRLELMSLDLAGVVRNAVEMNGFVAKGKNISVIADVEGPAVMKLDPGKIDQVLNNLLTNAVKFSHSGTEVRARLRRLEDGCWQLAVIDQGLGIPQAEQSSLFQPFQKTSVRGTAGEKSTGLGLAIVKRIVEGHGATITVESEPGKGSSFLVTFPPAE